MQTTGSLLCLWLASAASAVSAAFSLGYDRGTRAVIEIEHLDVGGGQAFSLVFPLFFTLAVSAFFFVAAVIGLLMSWRRNRQPLFSLPHAAAMLLMVPLGVALSFWLGPFIAHHGA